MPQYSAQNPWSENARVFSHLNSLDFMEKWADEKFPFSTEPPAHQAGLQLYCWPSSHQAIGQRQRGAQASRFLDIRPISGLGNKADPLFARILSRAAQCLECTYVRSPRWPGNWREDLSKHLFLLAIPPALQLQL